MAHGDCRGFKCKGVSVPVEHAWPVKVASRDTTIQRLHFTMGSFLFPGLGEPLLSFWEMGLTLIIIPIKVGMGV